MAERTSLAFFRNWAKRRNVRRHFTTQLRNESTMGNWLKNMFKTNIKPDSNIIKQAIIDYRHEGRNLMFELGNKYGLNINNSEEYEKLISRTNEDIPRKGILSKNWNYFFHGRECGFRSKSKQSIEVVLSNAPEFGHIDAWFLLRYMESTEKYRNEVNRLQSQDLKKMIDKLYDNGEVENIK